MKLKKMADFVGLKLYPWQEEVLKLLGTEKGFTFSHAGKIAKAAEVSIPEIRIRMGPPTSLRQD